MSKRRATKGLPEDFVDGSESEDDQEPAAKPSQQGSAVKQEPDSDSDNTESDEELQLTTPAKRAPKKQAASTPRQALAAAAAAAPAPVASEPWVDEAGWTIVRPSIIFRSFGFAAPSTKIAAFDLDATLINRKGNAEFPRNAEDWKFFNKSVPTRLAQPHQTGYKVVIFNNQSNIKAAWRGKQIGIIQQQLLQLYNSISALNGGKDVPLQVFLAPSNTTGDPCTKPATGMWTYMVQHCNGGLQPDLSQSFMVGDEDSDSAFAAAIGLPFHKPEQYCGPMDGKPRIDYEVVNAAKAAMATGTSEAPNQDIINQLRALASHTFAICKLAPPGKGPYGSESLKWKAIAYKKAADAISTLPGEITDAKSVGALKGVGKKTVEQVQLWLDTGSIRNLEDIEADEAVGIKHEVAAGAAAAAAAGPAYAFM